MSQPGSDAAAPIVGIDLGSCDLSCAFVNDQGVTESIPLDGDSPTLAAVFAVDSHEQELVGREARQQMELNPKRTIYATKQLLGRTYRSPVVQRMRYNLRYDLKQGDDGSVVIPLGESVMTPDEVTARLLHHVRRAASAHLNAPVRHAVIGVPAQFDDVQRRTVGAVGRAAGFDEVALIAEPVAIALAATPANQPEGPALVYDLGGRGFAASVVMVHPQNNTVDILASGGDLFLGGADFDHALVNYLLHNFSSVHNLDLRSDPVAMQRVRNAGENAKVQLSDAPEVEVDIPFVAMAADGNPIDLHVTLQRAELDALVEGLVLQTMDIAHTVLDHAGLTTNQLDVIYAAGGQAHMPLVRERLRHTFGKAALAPVVPDVAISHGAARYGVQLRETEFMSKGA